MCKRTRSRLFDDSLTTVEKEIPKSKQRKTTKNKMVKASKIKPNNAEKAKNNNAVLDPVQKTPQKGVKVKQPILQARSTLQSKGMPSTSTKQVNEDINDGVLIDVDANDDLFYEDSIENVEG